METILFAEDDEAFRYLTRRIFDEAGYRLLVANDGREAMEIARAHDGFIHLLVTNIVMPYINGIELSRQLIQLRPDTKVLYVTSGRHVEFSLLRKPFTMEELLAKVREILDAPPPLDGAVTTVES